MLLGTKSLLGRMRGGLWVSSVALFGCTQAGDGTPGAVPYARAPSSAGAGLAMAGQGAPASAVAGMSGALAPVLAASPPSAAGSAGSHEVPPLASTPRLDEHQTLIPDRAWSCGMEEGIPGPLTGQFVFDIDFDLGAVQDVGLTPFGHRRRLDIRGGSIDGPNVRGAVKSWGSEYELTLDTGVVEIEQLHTLQLGDDQVFMHNCGVSPGPGTPARVVLDFEAAAQGAHAFLNEGRYVATRVYDERLKLLRLKVFRVMGDADTSHAIHVMRPPGRPAQSLDCAAPSGTRGKMFYQAVVELAGYWSVGESKRGTRNVVPIVGGELSGQLLGRVLPGGADYQLSVADTLTLDARYMLELDGAELVMVRNCGTVGALVPVFEARTDGPYAGLNRAHYVSADPEPTSDLSGITLTIYEAP